MAKIKDYTKIPIYGINILEVTDKYRNKSILWKCQCQFCKEIFEASSVQLNNHLNSTTKCWHKCLYKVGTGIELTKQKFDGFTVIEPTNKRYHGYIVWKCKCNCGNEFEAPYLNIKNNNIKSCGCILRKNKELFKVKLDKNRSTKKYEKCKDFAIGYTKTGQRFIFDLEDFDRISKYSWHIFGNTLARSTKINNHYKNIKLIHYIFNIEDTTTIKKIIFKNEDNFDFRKNNIIIEYKKSSKKL